MIWQTRAKDDLLEIYEVIGLDIPAAAERVYDAIEAETRHLTEFPRLGPRRRDIGLTVRVLIEGPYLILFETHPDTDDGPIDSVEIVRVVDGRRELTGFFDR